MADALEKLSEESLMEHVQKHDHRAFSVLVERRSNMFYVAAYRMVMNREIAEDIVQEAFLKIWDKPAIWKTGKGAKFTTWFYRIVINMSVDVIRKESKNLSGDLTDDVASSDLTQEQKIVHAQEQQALDQALQSLPEKQLMALNLCFYEELSNKEAAEIMGVSVKALESLLMRAKAGIKNILYRDGILKQGDAA